MGWSPLSGRSDFPAHSGALLVAGADIAVGAALHRWVAPDVGLALVVAGGLVLLGVAHETTRRHAGNAGR